MTPAPWYQTSFGKEYLHVYTKYAQYLTDERNMQEVEAIIALLKLPPHSSILDLCCGQGRHALLFAQREYQVTGLDLSDYLLRLAQTEAEKQHVQIRWIRSDMREIPFEQEFDAVVNLFVAFGYLETDNEDQKVLQQVYKALKPGGRFLIETQLCTNDMADLRYQRTLQSGDGETIIVESSFNPLTRRIQDHFTLISPSGNTSEMTYSKRAYTVTELTRMLSSVGLEVQACYGDYNGCDLDREQAFIHRAVIISQKPFAILK